MNYFQLWWLLCGLIVAVYLRGSECSVDQSRPNISGFKLRHVDMEAEARKRAEKPIKRLDEGAIHMRESLFVDANYVKCPAYAHLFKLIKSQGEQQQQPRPVERQIRQSVIQSLAIVATYDRYFYHKLFLRSLAKSSEHFLEAAQDLEHRKETIAHEAWLDLLACLEEYMKDDLAGGAKVREFLSSPSRAEGLQVMSKFMSIPIPETETGAPLGLVSNLIKRYNNKDIVIDPNMYEHSHSVIVDFDDEDTAQQRVEEGIRQATGADNASSRAEGGQQLLVISAQEQEQLAAASQAGKADQTAEPTSEEVIKNIQLDGEIEIAAPAEAASPSASSPANAAGDQWRQPLPAARKPAGKPKEFSLDQLAILKFVKMRLESKRATPRLSMRLAFDFKAHFEQLLEAQLDPATELGREANNFRTNKNNLDLYEHVRAVTDDYFKIISVLAEIETLNDKYDGLEEFARPLRRLNRLLEKFDSAYDLNDIRRLDALWKLKYKEYSTIEDFIDNDGSW